MKKTLISNKKALVNFEIIENYEAGMILEGWEVKAIREGKMSLLSSYIYINKNEIFLKNSFVGVKSNLWKKGFETRDRKLLLNRQEIKNIKKSLLPGRTIIPVEVYADSKNLLKIKIALVKGLKRFEKRARLKEKDFKRKLEEEKKLLYY